MRRGVLASDKEPRMENQTIPLTILTGFLGSGKTTVLNNLLRDPRLTDTAVILVLGAWLRPGFPPFLWTLSTRSTETWA